MKKDGVEGSGITNFFKFSFLIVTKTQVIKCNETLTNLMSNFEAQRKLKWLQVLLSITEGGLAHVFGSI